MAYAAIPDPLIPSPSGLDALDVATQIGRQLCRDALWDGDRCNWLGWTIEPSGAHWMPATRTFGPDLYNGTAGVALFLAYLYKATDDPHIRTALYGALHHVVSTAESMRGPVQASLFSGWSGVAYTLTTIGEVLDQGGLVERGLRHFDNVAQSTPNDAAIDHLGGSAGTATALVDAALRFDRPDYLDAAVVFADHLLALGQRSERGLSWDTFGNGTHLLGYSHGTAGIAVALAEVYAATGETRFLDSAQAALRYEQSWFSEEHANWPDLRGGTDSPMYMAAWCHGAPGVGFSRLRLRTVLGPSDALDADLEAALSTTAAMMDPALLAQQNYSLCHGLGGNADLLLLAAQHLDRDDLRQLVARVGDAGAQRAAQSMPWPCGVQNAGETPSLMLGLAGIGYFYLRLHDPDGVPSVLIPWPRHSSS